MAKTQGSSVNEVRTRIRTKIELVKERKKQRDATLAARVKAMEELIAELSEALAFVLEYIEASMDTEIAVYSDEVGGEAKKRVEEMLAGKRVFLPAPVRAADSVGGAAEILVGDNGNNRPARVDGEPAAEVAAGKKR